MAIVILMAISGRSRADVGFGGTKQLEKIWRRLPEIASLYSRACSFTIAVPSLAMTEGVELGMPERVQIRNPRLLVTA